MVKILKKIGRFIWDVVEILIVCYVVFMTLCILSRNKYGFTQFGDYVLVSLNELRANNLNKEEGNLLIVKHTNDIKKGDVIYYYAPDLEEYVINTDVVTDVKKDGGKFLYTVGNRGKTVSSVRVLGRDAAEYKNLGTIKDTLESRVGFLLLVLLPIMIVFIYQIYRFVLIIKYGNKKDDDDGESNVETKEEKVEVTEIKSDDNANTVESVSYKETEVVSKSDDDIEIL